MRAMNTMCERINALDLGLLEGRERDLDAGQSILAETIRLQRLLDNLERKKARQRT